MSLAKIQQDSEKALNQELSDHLLEDFLPPIFEGLIKNNCEVLKT